MRNNILEEVITKIFTKLNETSNFYTPDKQTLDKLEMWIGKKMNENPDLDLRSWIYNNILRKANTEGHDSLKNWIKSNPENAEKFKKLCNHYLSKYSINNAENEIIATGQDAQSEWVGFNFNRKKKSKETHNNKELTYNYYITFERTPENFKAWMNSLHDLISKLYSACKNGPLQNSAISMKFGYNFNHYLEDNDHMKFYWYKREDESKVEGVVNQWLSSNKISTVQRPYTKGVDVGKSESWGVLVTNKVTDSFEDLLKQHGTRYTPKQYADYIINMLNTTKFKI